MIAVDTNVVVRLLVGDDPRQSARAKAIFSQGAILIPKSVVLETAWVLAYAYRQDRASVAAAIRAVAGLPDVEIEDSPSVARALDLVELGIDFADALHVAGGGDSQRFVTFDRPLAHRARGVTRIEVTGA